MVLGLGVWDFEVWGLGFRILGDLGFGVYKGL